MPSLKYKSSTNNSHCKYLNLKRWASGELAFWRGNKAYSPELQERLERRLAAQMAGTKNLASIDQNLR